MNGDWKQKLTDTAAATGAGWVIYSDVVYEWINDGDVKERSKR